MESGCLTVGDVPVSGTVNTIEIPSLASRIATQNVDIPAGGENYVTVIGSGTVLFIEWAAYENVDRDDLAPAIKIDGVQVSPFYSIPMVNVEAYHINAGANPPGWSWSLWDTANQRYVLQCVTRFSFRRKVEIGFNNLNSLAKRNGNVCAIIELIQ